MSFRTIKPPRRALNNLAAGRRISAAAAAFTTEYVDEVESDDPTRLAEFYLSDDAAAAIEERLVALVERVWTRPKDRRQALEAAVIDAQDRIESAAYELEIAWATLAGIERVEARLSRRTLKLVKK